MKVDYLEKQLLLIGVLAQDSLSRVAALVKEVFTRTHVYGDEEDKISYWQLIFLQSKVNGCSYRGEDLPHMNWQWPRDTRFQKQLSHHLKALEFATQRGGTCAADRLGAQWHGPSHDRDESWDEVYGPFAGSNLVDVSSRNGKGESNDIQYWK